LAPAFDDAGPTFAELAKKHSGLTVIANGHLDDPRDATTVVASGAADVVALAKPALANRDWPHRVRAGQPLSRDVPADVLGPIANLKDWELANPR
jgi:2,4-dienoyl-CoA reductase-like NADH-dependent reductase (Old Yellow Enzyme family)